MSEAARLAVEITKGEDNLDIWVDANNNGVRDDDDVNIYVTVGGGFYTTSPTFKQALDSTIQARIKELSIALLKQEGDLTQAEEVLRELALELVLKATVEAAPQPVAFTPLTPTTFTPDSVPTPATWAPIDLRAQAPQEASWQPAPVPSETHH